VDPPPRRRLSKAMNVWDSCGSACIAFFAQNPNGISLMFLTVAYQATSGAAAFTDQDMTLVSDPSVTNLNNHPIFPVPVWIQWAYVLGLTTTRARISAPRLRPITRPVVQPVDSSATPSEAYRLVEYFRHPVALNPVEEIQFLVTKTSAVAETDVAVLTVGDSQRNVPQGDMYTLRCTTAYTPTVGSWTSGALTADDTLQVGRYSIIGLRVNSLAAVAARLIFPGAPIMGGLPQIRPGVIATQSNATEGYWQFRYGVMGEFGQFESFALPQVEVLVPTGQVAAANPEVFLDIVPVRVGARAQ